MSPEQKNIIVEIDSPTNTIHLPHDENSVNSKIIIDAYSVNVKKSIKESKDIPLVESQVSDVSQPKQPYGPVKSSFQNFVPLSDLRGIESDPAFNKATIIENATIINATPKCTLNLNMPNFVRSSAINEIVTERTLNGDKSKN